MQLTDLQMKKFLEYKGTPQVKQLSLNMAYTRLKSMYQLNPSSLSQCTKELNTLLQKFERIMEADYLWITQL
jgi:hypothetical protein